MSCPSKHLTAAVDANCPRILATAIRKNPLPCPLQHLKTTYNSGRKLYKDISHSHQKEPLSCHLSILTTYSSGGKLYKNISHSHQKEPLSCSPQHLTTYSSGVKLYKDISHSHQKEPLSCSP
ncbi:hypothetical protein RRG08_036745 [Elysia crispata]|uniref:Uncharacterized protein n=1 Tax=Elysia crispata TaxID=231223 RepID=A0AAE0ZHS8_9GAST|nr:hypothetical protein RRG08_036745 [Elysia crispata]